MAVSAKHDAIRPRPGPRSYNPHLRRLHESRILTRSNASGSPPPAACTTSNCRVLRELRQGGWGPACCSARGVDAYALPCLVLRVAELDKLSERSFFFGSIGT